MFAKQQPMNFDTNLGTNIGSINQYFFFSGNAPSLQTRLDAMPDSQINQINDASIRVTGIEIKPRSELS